MSSPPIRRALLSVSNKEGLVEFARELVQAGVALYGSGGTRKALEAAGLSVEDISAYTGFPEMLEGRLKTLHPKVHGGLLARHNRDDDMQAISEHGIVTFELVVVNLYPFEETVAKEGVTVDEAIEQIDIGGPTLVRAAAKNHAFVTIVTEPSQYGPVLEQIKADGRTNLELRRELAAAAYRRTGEYDAAISNWFARTLEEPFPSPLNLSFRLKQTLRYGENPHQQGAFYLEPSATGATLASAEQLHGKELSYNNLLDLDSALAIARDLPSPGAVVIKHNNPCGAASGATLAEAFRAAYEGDPVSAFGSILGFNQTVDAATAEALAEPGRFIEAVIAPDFEPAAIEVLTTKPKWKNNVRLLQAGPYGEPQPGWEYRRVQGGLLVQQRDALADPENEWQVVTKRQPTDEELADLQVAWTVVRHVKSNAIVLGKGQAILGVGAGQMSRVDSVEIAIRKAGDRSTGAVLASDAFFPFPDSIERAASAGIRAVIQPGGSKNDPDVIAACDQHDLAMIFTGRRHFKH